MTEQVSLQTAAESGTEAVGASLARSLYKIPVTIGLSGALGTGKTAFIRGFLRELGIREMVKSPTYALEERYETTHGDVLHIDLYRLEPAEAAKLLLESGDFHGIRCIEWHERASETLKAEIIVSLKEETDGKRLIGIECSDASWPEDRMIDAWRKEVKLPKNVSDHCDAVASLAHTLALDLLATGVFVRPSLVWAGGRIHDLFKFIDFKPHAAPEGWESSEEERETWHPWKEKFGDHSHEQAIEKFLLGHGYPELSSVVRTHGVQQPFSELRTTEQRLLYYADKRVVGSEVVTIEERYNDFGKRYGKGTRSEESIRWEQEALQMEHLLFPEGPPH